MTTDFIPSPSVMKTSLQELLVGFKFVEWYNQINSTNVFLIDEAKNPNTKISRPALIGAHYQTSGKGRLGKKWSGDVGKTLMFSCAYDVFLPSDKLPLLAPIAGIVACDVLRKAIGEKVSNLIMMKWPNDILYKEAKLSGLLVESLRPLSPLNTNHYVIIVGMGMNLSQAKELSLLLDRPVADWLTVLRDLHLDDTHVSKSIANLVALIADAWKDAFLEYAEKGFTKFKNMHMSMDALKNQLVDVSDDGKFVLTGEPVGLDDDGRILIKLSNGQLLPLRSIDFSIRKKEIS